MFGIDDAALALLVAGGLSTAGALYTNAKNRKLQGNINDASINLANTAHQREVLDLMQAGINPILTAGGSGASVPQLNAAQVENPMQGLADSLGQSAKYVSDQYKLNNELTAADTNLTQKDAIKAEADGYSAIFKSAIDKKEKELYDNTFTQRKHNVNEQMIADWHKAEAEKEDAVMQHQAIKNIFNDNKKAAEYIKELQEGIMASAKDAANMNWRRNAGAITGMVNSAVNLYSTLRSGRAMPVNLEETIENFDRNGRFSGGSRTTRRGNR